MANMNFFIADIFIFSVIFLSFVVGWIRGGTREILSLFSWIFGGYLTIKIFPYAKDVTREYVHHGLLADFVTYCFLFIFFLIILSSLNYCCSNFVKKSVLNAADKFLGSIFGILRGIFIIVVLEFLATQYVFTEANTYIDNSKLKPFVVDASNFIILILPDFWQVKIFSHMSLERKQNILGFFEQDLRQFGDKALQTAKTEDGIWIKNLRVTAVAEDHSKNNSTTQPKDEADSAEEKNTQSAKELSTLKTKKSNMINVESSTKNNKKEKEDKNRVLDEYIL